MRQGLDGRLQAPGCLGFDSVFDVGTGDVGLAVLCGDVYL
jgi:hypothetical protein